MEIEIWGVPYKLERVKVPGLGAGLKMKNAWGDNGRAVYERAFADESPRGVVEIRGRFVPVSFEVDFGGGFVTFHTTSIEAVEQLCRWITDCYPSVDWEFPYSADFAAKLCRGHI